MTAARALLLALVLGSVHAAAPRALPLPALPGTVEAGARLPDLVLAARDVVLYAPDLTRPDLAEAIRQAIVRGAARVILLTDPQSFERDDSLTLRVLLMGVPTYVASGQGVPFVLLDGRALVGSGVTGLGAATGVSEASSRALAKWARGVTQARRPLDAVQIVREWVRRRGGPVLR